MSYQRTTSDAWPWLGWAVWSRKKKVEWAKRDIERFPEDFMFQLTKEEFENWKSQFATSNSIVMGARKRPYAFTEQGVAMLSGVLKSPTAVEANIRIMRAFVSMRHFMVNNVAFYLFNEKVPSGRNATWNLTYYFLFSLKNFSKKSICFWFWTGPKCSPSFIIITVGLPSW